jgi:hypothetical protein
MTRPFIQIDDEVREMTEEEYAIYLIPRTDETKLQTSTVLE